MTDILTLQRDAHQNSVDHGFWEATEDIPSKLMLIVSELSEALEAYRDAEGKIPLSVVQVAKTYIAPGDPHYQPMQVYGKPEGFPVEIADVVIRCMDLAGWLGFDLGAVVEQKMAYNATRPKLHGRKI